MYLYIIYLEYSKYVEPRFDSMAVPYIHTLLLEHSQEREKREKKKEKKKKKGENCRAFLPPVGTHNRVVQYLPNMNA